MECCSTYTDLGCIGSCTDEIQLPGSWYNPGHSASEYQINVTFPDVVKIAEPIVGDANLKIANILNEDYAHRIAVYYRGELQECFKIKTFVELC